MPRIKGINKSGVEVGTIMALGQDDYVPAGFLLCDGSAVSRVDYAELFAVIASKWGDGDTTTTFNLPDMRGRFARGRDNGAGRDPDAGSRTENATGGATGDNVGSVQEDAFQSHVHRYDCRDWDGDGNNSQLVTASTGANRTAPRDADFVDYEEQGTNGTPRFTSETRSKNANVRYVIAFA